MEGIKLKNHIEKQQGLHLNLLKELKVDKVKSLLQILKTRITITLAFSSLVAFYACYFATLYTHLWYFTFSGIIVALFSFWLVWSSIKQLKLILSIDYEAVVMIQEKLAKLKTAIVQNLRIVAWLLPFGPFVGLFFFKALFNIDLMVFIDFNMILSFGITTIILEVISLLVLKVLRLKHLNSKLLDWLLQGYGSQINKALKHLKAVEDFQTESSQ
ncbi:hypothetical protein J8L85_14240 [Maribacter sp. MMG018]|uniref:hypothetical protein n=1 Tax=Maribacter sp. MMG018 TaxID=2822688 RepID=UPI001B396B86|nr:hypothetical protein [Maribacter sp. MMG018]MBQ4915611.1 hypothetical protein [Maribacter sp. MMG018]